MIIIVFYFYLRVFLGANIYIFLFLIGMCCFLLKHNSEDICLVENVDYESLFLKGKLNISIHIILFLQCTCHT